MRPFLIDLPNGAEAMIDAYVWRSDTDDQGDVLARHLHAAIRAAEHAGSGPACCRHGQRALAGSRNAVRA